MQKSNNNILNFFYNQKYILIIILIVSLIISYIIQKNSLNLGLDKVEVEKKIPQVIFTDYNYYIWYKRNYKSGHMNFIIGRVFENMGIETFNDKKFERIPNPMQTNVYGYFRIRTLDSINEDDFYEKFELEKKKFINEELKIINDFRSYKKDKNLLIEKEFNIYKTANAIIYLKEIKRVRETSIDYAKDIISKLNGNEKHYSNNIKLIKEEKKLEDIKKKKLFYHPEIIILILYISYFSFYFFIQLIKEND